MQAKLNPPTNGNAVHGTAGLALLGLFPQDRWTFLIAMSLFVAFCTYMMGSTTRWYFWFIAGITVPIVVGAAHQSEAMVRELREEVRSWRVGVQAIFARLAGAPEAADGADYRRRLVMHDDRLNSVSEA